MFFLLLSLILLQLPPFFSHTKSFGTNNSPWDLATLMLMIHSRYTVSRSAATEKCCMKMANPGEIIFERSPDGHYFQLTRNVFPVTAVIGCDEPMSRRPSCTPLRNEGLRAGLIKGNQWVFISSDHQARYFRGGPRYGSNEKVMELHLYPDAPYSHLGWTMARFKGKWLGKCSLHGASGIWFFDVSDPSFFFSNMGGGLPKNTLYRWNSF